MKTDRSDLFDYDVDQYKLNEIVIRFCEPIFLSAVGEDELHSKNTINATITYVKYRGIVYGVTCAHVYDLQFDLSHNTKNRLLLRGIDEVYDISSTQMSGLRKFIHSVDYHDDLDIAIVKFPSAFETSYLRRKEKIPFDLDKWETPPWKEIITCVAYGFPTEHKGQTKARVEANLLTVVAEVTRTIEENDSSFLLASSLEEENSYYFSGMSGGPVCCIKDGSDLLLIGIIFEGTPGNSEGREKRSPDAIFSMNDVQIRACLLTSSNFSRWLEAVGIL